jgi:hypothetical protein
MVAALGSDASVRAIVKPVSPFQPPHHAADGGAQAVIDGAGNRDGGCRANRDSAFRE